MKSTFVSSLLIVVCCASFAQNKYKTRRELLLQLQRRTDITHVKVTEIKRDILKLEYPNGKVQYKNIADYRLPTAYNLQPTNYSPTFDSTIIDLTTIDTTLYYKKYHFWREAPIGSQDEPIIGDINNNGLPEFYGHYDIDTSNLSISEMNSNGNFHYLHEYDSAQVVKSIYDIDKDGGKELLLGSNSIFEQYPGNCYLFYKKQSDSSLATQLSFVFYRFGGQQENNYFGDWDGDVYTDWIFFNLSQGPPSIDIYEYNPFNNNFDSVYEYSTNGVFYGGFAIGDFDQDRKTEFLGGSINGDIVSIENDGDNSYRVNWTGSVETWNAYLATQTNDLDGNGRDEIWIMGDAFYNGVPKTRITIFEANGNDSYQAVGRIDLIGVFSFDAGNIQSLDVDKDGKDEVMVCIDGNVIILKFAGRKNDQKYKIYYIKQNRDPDIIYYGATMYDLDNSGKEEIIISTQNYPSTGYRLLSDIYTSDPMTNVIKEKPETPENYYLCQNYPNPFNPTTTIEYRLPQKVFVTLKVYNILGQEVKTLVNRFENQGKHQVKFDAANLPSGVYIYSMRVNDFVQNRKMILMK